ncbi:hypothetical protein Hesp01_08950 [Herbidospora sp. NBRC 101105]|nr:hypothetical protein Hesp01_08950 [Herbidospora sp. NBRC 101105]
MNTPEPDTPESADREDPAPDPDPGPGPGPGQDPGGAAHLEGSPSGDGRVYQAAGDQHMTETALHFHLPPLPAPPRQIIEDDIPQRPLAFQERADLLERLHERVSGHGHGGGRRGHRHPGRWEKPAGRLLRLGVPAGTAALTLTRLTPLWRRPTGCWPIWPTPH